MATHVCLKAALSLLWPRGEGRIHPPHTGRRVQSGSAGSEVHARSDQIRSMLATPRARGVGVGGRSEDFSEICTD